MYYIGVYCATKSEFTLIATTDIEPIYMLNSGLPQYSKTDADSRSVFYFWSYSDYEIQIKLSLISGQVIMLANPQNPTTEEMYSRIPTQNSYT